MVVKKNSNSVTDTASRWNGDRMETVFGVLGHATTPDFAGLLG